MKRRKKLFILLGALVVAIIALVIVVQVKEKKEKIKNSSEVILAIDSSSVTALSWEYEDTTLSFTKGETWQWDDDSEFAVSQEAINELLAHFENFTAEFTIDDVSDFGQYGLDEPTCTIKIKTNDAETKIVLGAYSSMDSKRYVSVGDGKVYLVSDDPFEYFNIEIKDMIKNDTIPEIEEITSIQFGGKYDYTLYHEDESDATYCKDDVYFVDVDGKTIPLDTSSVNSYVSLISGLSLTSYATYNATEQELKEYGLDNPLLTVTVKFIGPDVSNNNSFKISLGRNQTQLTEESNAILQGEEYSGVVTSYVRINDSKIVYEITDATYQSLILASYNDLRHKEVLTADFDDITSIEFTLEDETYVVTEDKTDEDGTTYKYNGEEITFSSIKNGITSLAINEFTKDVEPGREELSIKLLLNNENYPEITIKLYRYDGLNCITELNGEIIGLTDRYLVVDLIEYVREVVLG